MRAPLQPQRADRHPAEAGRPKHRLASSGKPDNQGAVTGLSSTSARDEARALLVAALSRVAAGDRLALRDVYERTSAKLFGIILRICQEREAAEDVLQEVYVTVWNRAAGYDPERASPVTWLATIARNRAIDWRRARRPVESVGMEEAEAIADDAALAPERIEAEQEARRLHTCLDEIENKQAGAIRAAFLGGATYAELAERDGVPLGTMKSWVRRGLLKLRECLDRG